MPISFDRWSWYLFLFGVAVQTSTAATSVLAGGAILWCLWHRQECLLACADRSVRPIVLAIGLLGAAILFGVTVALANGISPWLMLGKHLPFLFFFLVLGLFQTPERRLALLLGFSLGAAFALLTSLYSAALGTPILSGNPDDFNTFRKHIEHNIFLGLAALFLGEGLLIRSRPDRWEWLGWLMFWLATFDILHLVQGRTGQIVFALVLAWVIGHALRRKRWLVAALTVVVTVVSVLPSGFGHKSALESGIEMAQRDVSSYQEGRAKTSVAYRLDFAKTSWQLVRERPLVGYGTGAFVPAYAEYVKLHDPIQEPTHNPHNDYLFYWIESGLPGLVAVIALYAVALIGAWRIGGLRGTCLGALVLAWAISGLANSMLLDHPTSFAFVALLAALASGPLPFGERTVLARANQEAAGNAVTKLRSP